VFLSSDKQPRTAEQLAIHQARYGKDHQLPPNFTEITPEEFARSMFFTHSPLFWEYRQVNAVHVGRRLGDLRLAYFFDHTGIAFEVAYCAGVGQRPRYFKFGPCLHTRTTRKNVGNCLNTYTCDDCGYAQTVDSSD
jgi:hypothetical protein